MILTGKAKEDFCTWINRDIPNKESFECEMNINDLYFKTSTELYALIIEWFDSVGVYVDVVSNSQTSTFDAYVDDDYIYFYHSRKEATEQAIIKANQIYNDRTK